MKKVLGFIAIVIVISVSYWLYQTRSYGRAVVSVGDVNFDVEVARTLPQQTKGLGGREMLAEGRGMLFVYDEPAVQTFWMRGVQFPIDIIWIRDGVIVGSHAFVPIPELDVPRAELPRYGSGVLVDTVLELNAGSVERYGLYIGSLADIQYK